MGQVNKTGMKRRSRSQTLAFNVSFCGIISAISVITMFGSLIPSFAYAVPALAGMVLWIPSDHMSDKWSYMCYAAVSLISFMLIPELEANFFFIFFFGYYPTLCNKLDKIENKVIRFLVKLGIFNVAVVCAYNVLAVLLSAQELLEDMDVFGEYAVYVFWGAGNIVFVVYNISVTYVKKCYTKVLKPRLMAKIK